MYESPLEWDKIDCKEYIYPLFVFVGEKKITTTNFNVQDYPEGTYAYSITENVWYKSKLEGTFIKILLWSAVSKHDVPFNLTEEVKCFYKS